MAAKRTLLRGYKALPGTARRVEGPKGENLSHRQYRNRVVQASGWRNLSELENDEEWAKFRFKIREHDPGRDVSYRSQSVADFVAVKRERERNPPRVEGGRFVGNPALEPYGKDMDQTPLGRLLIASGQAEPDQRWGVDSPKKRSLRDRGEVEEGVTAEEALEAEAGADF